MLFEPPRIAKAVWMAESSILNHHGSAVQCSAVALMPLLMQIGSFDLLLPSLTGNKNMWLVWEIGLSNQLQRLVWRSLLFPNFYKLAIREINPAKLGNIQSLPNCILCVWIPYLWCPSIIKTLPTVANSHQPMKNRAKTRKCCTLLNWFGQWLTIKSTEEKSHISV